MLWYAFLLCLTSAVFAGLYVKGLRRWFLAFGCVGVLVALALIAIRSRRMLNPKILIVLWPPSIAGLAEPQSLLGEITLGTFEFAGNFILYGAIGTLVGLCVRRGTGDPNVTRANVRDN